MDEIKSAVDIFRALPEPAQWMALVMIVAKMITPWTKSRRDNKFYDWIFRALNVLAMNVGKDKNADEQFPARVMK